MPMSTMMGSDTYHVCLQCGNTFKDRSLAQQCENQCTKGGANNLQSKAEKVFVA